MTDITGLVVNGDELDNDLKVIIKQSNGDRLIYNIVKGGYGDDDITGLSDSDVFTHYGTQLFGGEGNDTIVDSRGDDTLHGGPGDDLIISYHGNDVIDGGPDIDTLELLDGAVLSSANLSIHNIEKLALFNEITVGDFNLNQFASISGSGTLSFNRKANVQSGHFKGGGWEFNGSAFNDTLNVAGSAGTFTINGGDGNDSIWSGRRSDELDGGDGNDTLLGGGMNDTIDGGKGNDLIYGGTGKDFIFDSGGNNTIHGGDDRDTIDITGGHNTVFGDDGDDRIFLTKVSGVVSGSLGNDTITLLQNPDLDEKLVLHGGAGEDTLVAQGDVTNIECDGIERLTLVDYAGKIVMSARALNKFESISNVASHEIRLSSSGDLTWKHVPNELGDRSTLIGAAGDDHLDLSKSTLNWTIGGGAGDDVIKIGPSSLSDINEISGGSGSDTLTGGSMTDYIRGDSGNDVLVGSDGYDSLTGGGGKDTFVFTGRHGQTHVTDFDTKGGTHDIIDLSAVKSLKGFTDLVENHTVSYNGFIIIWFGDNNVILSGLSVKDLHASDFIF